MRQFIVTGSVCLVLGCAAPEGFEGDVEMEEQALVVTPTPAAPTVLPQVMVDTLVPICPVGGGMLRFGVSGTIITSASTTRVEVFFGLDNPKAPTKVQELVGTNFVKRTDGFFSANYKFNWEAPESFYGLTVCVKQGDLTTCSSSSAWVRAWPSQYCQVQAPTPSPPAPLTLSLLGAAPQTVECNPRTSYQEPGYKASQGTADLTSKVNIAGVPNMARPGLYNRAYWVENSGSRADKGRAVTVKDSLAPTIYGLSGYELFPPRHQYYRASLEHCVLSVVDTCEGSLNRSKARITHVTSDELPNSLGDGNTDRDIKIVSDREVDLMMERSGRGDGRVYTIHYEVVDSVGNKARSSCTYSVPQSRARRAGNSGVMQTVWR